MNKLKLAIIGLGNIASKHLPVLAQFDDVELVAFCDTNEARLHSVAAQYGVKQTFVDCKHILAEVEVDAVFSFVNVLNTFSVVTACLEAGRHTFLEKPPGISSAETRQLADLADEHGCLTMVGVNRRFYSSVKEAQQAIAAAGPLVSIVLDAPENLARVRALKFHPQEVIQHWIFANGIHGIDLLRYIGGEILQVQTVNRQWFDEQPDSFGALVEFKSGAIGHYISDWTSPGGWRMELRGRDIKILLEPLEQSQLIQRDGTTKPLPIDDIDLKFKAGFYAQDRYFLDCVRQKRSPEFPALTLRDAVETMKLIEAITGVVINPFSLRKRVFSG
ncbi:Gfo/Idh/MocA family oxidoreductase [Candidatus Poribacteria bacterium]|nr:Gfo/Idh/MocA family oxidoreductase [Candidatus Poribacteria bacterium]